MEANKKVRLDSEIDSRLDEHSEKVEAACNGVRYQLLTVERRKCEQSVYPDKVA